MSNPSAPVLRPRDAASYCGLSVATFARLRGTGDGPRFIQLHGRNIGYRVADLDAWLASRPGFVSTSQRDAAA
jgi:predicted DNA-binding transcriptional regulator AlpA